MIADVISNAISNGAVLSFTARDKHLSFSDDELYLYACIGKFVGELADLEFALDEFVTEFANRHPKLALSISRNRPITIEDKARFVALAFALFPKLRECGDGDGYLNLQFLFYGIIELFDKRNYIVHGSWALSFTKSIGGTKEFEISSRKYSRIEKGIYKIDRMRYHSDYIEKCLFDASYFESLLFNANRIVQGRGDPKEEREEQQRSRVKLRELRKRALRHGVEFV